MSALMRSVMQAAVTGNFSGIVNFAKNAALDAPLEDAIERIRAGVE